MSEYEKLCELTGIICKKCTASEIDTPATCEDCEDVYEDVYENCDFYKEIIPDLTADKILELICLLTKYQVFCLKLSPTDDFEGKWDIEHLDNYVIKQLIYQLEYNEYEKNRNSIKEDIKRIIEG